MTDLHPVLTDHKLWKRYAAEVERAEAKYHAVTEKICAAEAEHDEQMRDYRAKLDAGTAPTTGPPLFHPPADPGKLHADRLALRARRREVLSAIAADGGEDALRAREGDLLNAVAELVAELEPLRDELATLRASLRSIASARGIPASATTIPDRLDMAELVEVATHRGSVLPVVLVEAPEPAPDWTRDDPDAAPDFADGRARARRHR